ncbi:hypothetical protein SAMD00023353_1000910 [Rosellinia necatrix]|uniref:Uncharacterized protein n=1 Tax=Rosellinia necatrix TaxID=77044 RepID=A0A1W2TBU2_ROSNE|nr:hypothetical protein SAMD00023353_1000910 [Rosellinia necatrix]
MAPPTALPIKATRTLPQALTGILSARQETTTVVASDGDGGGGGGGTVLSGGAIAGIVVGSIAGFLLLLWVVRSCVNIGRPGGWGDTFEPDHEKPPSSPRWSPYRGADTRHHHHHHHARSPRRHHHHRHHQVDVVQPVAAATVVARGSRSRSPRAPPAAYYGRPSYDGDGRGRRSSDARGYRY